MAGNTIDKMMESWEQLHEEAAGFYHEGDMEAAEHVLANCRQLAERMGESGLLPLGVTLNTLAGVYRSTGRLNEALAASLSAWELLKDALDEDDFDMAGTAWNTAQLCAKAGRKDEALALMNRALELMDKSLGADSPQKAQVWVSMARCLAEGGDREHWEEFLRRAMEIALTDPQGDTLAEAALNVAAEYGGAERLDDACAALALALEAQEKLYLEPVEDDLKDPSWVLDFNRARNIVFRRMLQEEGVDPDPMNRVRLHLARGLLEAGRCEEALPQFARIEEQMVHHEERIARLSEDDDEMDEDDEPLTPIAEVEDEELDDEAEGHAGCEDEGCEGCEDCDGEEEEDALDEVDRSAFFADYGYALHACGQSRRDRDLLEQAEDKYELALDFAEESEDGEEIRKEVETNLVELKGDLSGL